MNTRVILEIISHNDHECAKGSSWWAVEQNVGSCSCA